MIVAHELNQLDLGGAERVVLNIAANDRKRTHIVIAHRDGPMRVEFEKAGVRVYQSMRGDAVNLDVAHVHTGGDPSVIAAHLNGELPVVETIHSPLPSGVPAHLVTRRIACSGVVASFNPGAQVIYNGVDFTRLEPLASRMDARRELGIPRDAFVIGWLGRIVPEKSIDAHLQVAKKLMIRYPKACACIVGPHGDGKVAAALRRDSALLGVPLYLPGPRNPGRAFPAFDVFLCLSQIEAMPLTYVEAMWCGATMVLADTPVGRELTRDGSLADLVEPKDAWCVADAVTTAVGGNPAHFKLMRDAQRQHALEFSVARMVEAYGKVYEEVFPS